MADRIKQETQFIILHETVLQSWARDASSFTLFAGLIGLGILLESSAMQWAGFLVAMTVLFSRVGKMSVKRMTREEAIRYLQEVTS